MRFELTGYQHAASEKLLQYLDTARYSYSKSSGLSAIVLRAATGAGKTVIATSVIEQLLYGGDNTEPDPLTTILWVTDDPSLNQQTMQKMMEASEKLTATDFRVIGGGATINEETFAPGTVYFLNIQAARKGATMTTKSDTQTYTLWDTIANTVTQRGGSFIVVVDEAHRGVEQKAKDEDETIVNKVVNGTVPVPVFIGISATTQKLDEALERDINALSRTVMRHEVPMIEVQASGLIKDHVVLHNPDEISADLEADTTLVRVAVQRTLAAEAAWNAYTTKQGEPPVVPALVVQLPNSQTDEEIAEVVDAILNEWPGLKLANIINTFKDHAPINLGNYRAVKYVAPHLIQDDTSIRVVLAKNAVTTGWDCPRAEVLISLRTSKEYTPIAQLIGRTLRQPLARRIDGDESLNKVYALLPRFDSKNVDKVVAELNPDGASKGENLAVRATATYRQIDGHEAMFAKLGTLPSNTLPSQVPVANTRRLNALATNLSSDGIYPDAATESIRLMNVELDAQKARIGNEEFEKRRDQVSRVQLIERTVTVAGEHVATVASGYGAKLDANNIDDLFRRASRRLRDGVAENYWKYLVGETDDDDVVEHRITVAALGMDDDAANAVQLRAGQLVAMWLHKYGVQISELKDVRRSAYERIQATAGDPQPTTVQVADVIEETVVIDGDESLSSSEILAKAVLDSKNRFDKHLYVDDTESKYWSKLNDLERKVLTKALEPEGSRWYRNPTGKDRALRLTYKKTGESTWSGLYPDFVVLFPGTDGVEASVIDPHGHQFSDAVDKIRALSAYASEHAATYRGIHSIAEVDGAVTTLTLHQASLRKKVLALFDSGGSAEQAYRELGVPY